jgi:hypothetical protein
MLILAHEESFLPPYGFLEIGVSHKKLENLPGLDRRWQGVSRLTITWMALNTEGHSWTFS